MIKRFLQWLSFTFFNEALHIKINKTIPGLEKFGPVKTIVVSARKAFVTCTFRGHEVKFNLNANGFITYYLPTLTGYSFKRTNYRAIVVGDLSNDDALTLKPYREGRFNRSYYRRRQHRIDDSTKFKFREVRSYFRNGKLKLHDAEYFADVSFLTVDESNERTSLVIFKSIYELTTLKIKG